MGRGPDALGLLQRENGPFGRRLAGSGGVGIFHVSFDQDRGAGRLNQPPPTLIRSLQALQIDLATETLGRLGAFLDRLLETNRRFNLTAVREPQEAWDRHILDSVSLIPFLPEEGRVIDVGSGGGLPALPLAIACPGLAVTALESTGKKARFIAETAEAMGLENLEVIQDRAETAGQDPDCRERYDTATARGVGPMNVLLELTLPLVRVGGRVLAMKGARTEQELRDCGDGLMLLGAGPVAVHETLPGIEPEAVVVEVLKDRRTPAEYPRRPGVPKKEPL